MKHLVKHHEDYFSCEICLERSRTIAGMNPNESEDSYLQRINNVEREFKRGDCKSYPMVIFVDPEIHDERNFIHSSERIDELVNRGYRLKGVHSIGGKNRVVMILDLPDEG